MSQHDCFLPGRCPINDEFAPLDGLISPATYHVWLTLAGQDAIGVSQWTLTPAGEAAAAALARARPLASPLPAAVPPVAASSAATGAAGTTGTTLPEVHDGC
jgi:hypothetical protein